MYSWWNFCIIVLLASICCAVPKPDDAKKERLVDKLSGEKHYSENEEHNVEFDHEAFLGREEAKAFDQLSPEESKARLGLIVEKIDKDKDGFVTEEELKDWIQYTQKKYILDDVERQWKSHNPENNELLSWDYYKKITYSFIDESEDKDENSDIKTYREMMLRDKRRWTTADKNNDGSLSKEEFADFLHPEEAAPHMQDVVIIETLEDIDKDHDGKISLDEYIGDMYSGSEDEQPDWVQNEKEQFTAFRDKNKDGFLDKDEVREWILPSDYNHSEAEAKHLIYEADQNKDQKLTKEEIMNNYDLFVGSQATDFGEALVRHDEF